MTEEARAREVLIRCGAHEATDCATGLVPYDAAIAAMLAYAKPADREAMTAAARELVPNSYAMNSWHVIDRTIDAILSLPHPKQGEMT